MSDQCPNNWGTGSSADIPLISMTVKTFGEHCGGFELDLNCKQKNFVRCAVVLSTECVRSLDGLKFLNKGPGPDQPSSKIAVGYVIMLNKGIVFTQSQDPRQDSANSQPLTLICTTSVSLIYQGRRRVHPI